MQKQITLNVGFTAHDARVIIFHCIIAAAQAVLLQLGKENFGYYTPYAVMGIQVLSEALRRVVV